MRVVSQVAGFEEKAVAMVVVTVGEETVLVREKGWPECQIFS